MQLLLIIAGLGFCEVNQPPLLKTKLHIAGAQAKKMIFSLWQCQEKQGLWILWSFDLKLTRSVLKYSSAR